MGMKELCCKILSNSRLCLFLLAVISAVALAMAYTSQYVYGMQPCNLCLYQRVPYALVILFGFAGIALSGKWSKAGPVFLGLSAMAFLANAVIAFYHTGVERKWWASFLEGCTIPSLEGNIMDVLAQIEAAPMARCDEIPWTDPVIGLSMANYNVALCLGLFAVAAIAAIGPSVFCRK
ncbi:MAG: disulfide bond formation protein B [Micavibrio sp.]